MKVIGVTGGIGTGKSTVAEKLKRHGAYVIDADKIAKRVIGKGQKTLDLLVDYFGTGILNDIGEIDRKRLADIVFQDAKKLSVLNEIVHQEVHRQIREEIEELRNSQYNGIIVLDVPIPTNDFKQLSDEIWVVDSDLDKRLERVKKRSGFSREEVIRRINAQITREEYLSIADKVIINNESEKKLEDVVLSLINPKTKEV